MIFTGNAKSRAPQRAALLGLVLSLSLSLLPALGAPGVGPPAAAPRLDVLLTFDDGPVPESLHHGTFTEKVLSVLQERRAKATFFIQIYSRLDNGEGRFFRGNTDEGKALVRRMADAGHVVGLHSASFIDHVDHTLQVNKNGSADPQDELWRDFDDYLEQPSFGREALRWIEHYAGRRPEFVRPCYGDHNCEVRAVYRHFGLKNVLWDIDPRDWNAALSVDDIRQRIYDQVLARAKSGDRAIIVIFHDTVPHTYANLKVYLASLEAAATAGGRRAHYPADRDEAARIMRVWSAQHPDG